jgi:phosphoadenosine phosphosulfate reductase
MVENRLPRHPLVAKGFPSIGCAPCTSPVKPPARIRAQAAGAGRQKTECGIHFIDGKAVQIPKENAA